MASKQPEPESELDYEYQSTPSPPDTSTESEDADDDYADTQPIDDADDREPSPKKIKITIENDAISDSKTYYFTNGDFVTFSKTHPNGILPTRGSRASIGFDLFSPVLMDIRAGGHYTILTNIKISHFPAGCYGQIADRSGLAATLGLTTLGGIIDPDYQGSIGVILHNTNPTKSAFIREKGPIAQLLFVNAAVPLEENALPQRNTKGLGRNENI
jgi:deoxyuridine 5'-triphosphate nucleotidohydrolase